MNSTRFTKQNPLLSLNSSKVELSTELVCHVGVVAGERTPVITDRNPHLETLMDSRRAVYLPHTEDANMVVDLPNMSGNKKGGATSCGISTIHFRNVFHDAEIDGGGRVCLL